MDPKYLYVTKRQYLELHAANLVNHVRDGIGQLTYFYKTTDIQLQFVPHIKDSTLGNFENYQRIDSTSNF